MTGRIGFLLVICACTGRPELANPSRPAAALDVPPAADAAAHVTAGQARWLAGDLDGAIAELERAGGDRRARGLLARAYAIAGRPADARRIAERAIANAHPELGIATDVSKVSWFVHSRDGAYVATFERADAYGTPHTITIWNTLTGRALVSTVGDDVDFGHVGGVTVAVVVVDAGKMRAIDVETGEERWSYEIDKTWDLAIGDQTVTTLMQPDSHVVQWDLATGRKLRTVPLAIHATNSMKMSRDGATVLADGMLLDLAHDAAVLAVLPPDTTESGIEDMRLSPDGQRVAISNKDRSVTLYDRTGLARLRLGNAGTHVEFLDDNTLVATAGTHITRWDLAGHELAAFELPPGLVPMGSDERLAIGPGGQVVVRRGAELAIVQVATNRPIVIAQLGFSMRADMLTWSADGNELVIAAPQDLLTWDVAGRIAASARPDKLPAPSELELDHDRVFVRAPDGHASRAFEALATVTAAATDGHTVVAGDASGMLDVWNAVTGEGLGTIAGTSAVTALALRGDGRTLAVARKTGGIELWDLPSRTHLLTLVAARETWAVFTPSGRFDGQPRGLDWTLERARFPGTSFGAIEHGLATTVLAHPPPAIAITPTPPPEAGVRACLPADVTPRPLAAILTGNVFTFCFGDDRYDPYCFALDIPTRKVAAVPPPLDVLAPPPHVDDSSHEVQVERSDSALVVCITPESCRTVAVSAEKADRVAVSSDGVVVALGYGDDLMETWNAVTGKRIARFKVHYGARDHVDASGGRAIEFWGHNIVASFTPCAGPCGDATVFGPRGKDLGSLPFEPSGIAYSRFHDDLWILANEMQGFAVADATNDIMAEVDANAFKLATDHDHIAAVFARKHVARVVVYGRLGKLVAEAKVPRCR